MKKREKKKIVVIGSINMDLVCRTPRMPIGGETILGGPFVLIPGGKGANQAVAAAKLGGDVHLIGRVGDDAFGGQLLAGLNNHGVHAQRVKVTPGVASGVAMILVDSAGQNSIVVAPGANSRVSRRDIDASRDLIASAAIVVLQLEIPLPVVRYAIALCRKLGVFTMLDPAPAPVGSLPRDVFAVDVLTPNESESAILLGRAGESGDAPSIAAALLKKGARSVLLKLGPAGAAWFDRSGLIQSAGAMKIKIVDTTAAGDAFTGGFAVARAESMPKDRALRFACAAGSLCCRTLGAQPSLPSRTQVERSLKQPW